MSTPEEFNPDRDVDVSSAEQARLLAEVKAKMARDAVNNPVEAQEPPPRDDDFEQSEEDFQLNGRWARDSATETERKLTEALLKQQEGK